MALQHTAVGGQEQTPRSLDNRRVTVRYLCPPATPGRLVVVDKQEMQRAWLLDLSLGGVGLLLGRPLESGLLVVVRVKSSDGRQLFELAGHVTHSTKQNSGDWLIGCELVTRLTPEELEALL